MFSVTGRITHVTRYRDIIRPEDEPLEADYALWRTDRAAWLRLHPDADDDDPDEETATP